MKKKIVIILIIIIIILLVGKLYQSYALTSIVTSSTDDSIIVNVYDNSTIQVSANSGKTVYYKIINPNDGQLRYGVGYTNGNIDVKIYSDSRDPETGLINYGESKFVKLRLINATSTNSVVTLSTIFGYVNGGNLIVPSNVSLVSEEYYLPLTAVEYINKLYNLSTKTEVINNNITYQYDYTNNLMYDNNRNIRYFGANPNNYIYFNCDDYNNQSASTCEKWRIIGLVNDYIKIIRNESIDSLAWDHRKNIDSSLTSSFNSWSSSSLQILLNEKYYNGNTVGTVTYYSGSSGDISTSLNLASIGLKNDTTRNLIGTKTYYSGGYNSTSVYSDTMYNYEETISWNGKVVLALPSDYGYAADFNYCTQTLGSYKDCISYNWMKDILGTSSYGWLLTPNSSDSNHVWCIASSGNVNYYNYSYNAYGVVPVVSLYPHLKIKDGLGTSSYPYQLSLS